jgi:hypothetical protein
MKLNRTKYIVVKKGYPIHFIDGDGYEVDDIEKAELWYSKEKAVESLKDFDYPEEFEVIQFLITYEI